MDSQNNKPEYVEPPHIPGIMNYIVFFLSSKTNSSKQGITGLTAFSFHNAYILLGTISGTEIKRRDGEVAR